MKTLSKLFILILVFLASSVLCQVDYSNEIQPIFNNNCIGCHGGNHPTGLDLTSHAGVLAGSNSGAVVLPNNSTESLLWRYVNSGYMPYFSDDLTSPEIDSIAQWINQGAKIIGGCCAIGPEHIKTLHDRLIAEGIGIKSRF